MDDLLAEEKRELKDMYDRISNRSASHKEFAITELQKLHPSLSRGQILAHIEKQENRSTEYLMEYAIKAYMNFLEFDN